MQLAAFIEQELLAGEQEAQTQSFLDGDSWVTGSVAQRLKHSLEGDHSVASQLDDLNQVTKSLETIFFSLPR